jgi:hypothetical protein
VVLEQDTHFDCIRPLVSQLKWLLCVSDILVDVLIDKFLDRVDATRYTILPKPSVRKNRGR